MKCAGALGRENVGMSNHKSGERPDRRKPKVSSAMAIIGGLGAPKRNPAFEQGIAMDSRLIFRPLGTDRWSDGTQYVERVIGFNVHSIRMVRRENLSDRRKADPSAVKIAARRDSAKRVFKKSS